MFLFKRLIVGAMTLSVLALTATGAAVAKSSDDGKTGVRVAAASPSAAPSSQAKPPKVDRKTFGEWELECFEPEVNGLKCQIIQKLVSKDNNQLVLVVSIAHEPKEKKDLLQMALPLNFMLKPGVEIAIGDAKTVVQVDRCSAQGCFVEGIAGEALVNAMAKGTKADVKFLANAEKRLVIPFSLSGFTKAYKTMKTRNAS
ncbi:MAG: invasion associated locus B family protein [Pseudomonadota bacterium]